MKKFLVKTCFVFASLITSYAHAEKAVPAATASNETTAAIVDTAESGSKSAAHSALDAGASALGADSEVLGIAKTLGGEKADSAIGSGADSVRGKLGVAAKNAPTPAESTTP